MNVAYIRPLSADQIAITQLESVKAYNIEKIFEEKFSKKMADRPELKNMLNFIQENDTLYVESISCLAYNSLYFLKLIEHFSAKKITLISMKENLNTSTSTGKIIVSLLLALLKLEHNKNKQRQHEGIDLALLEKRPYGRPKAPITDEFKLIYQQWKNGEMTAVKAIEFSGYKKNTFYRRVKEIEKSVNGHLPSMLLFLLSKMELCSSLLSLINGLY